MLQIPHLSLKEFTSGVLYYLNKGLQQALHEYSYMIVFPK